MSFKHVSMQSILDLSWQDIMHTHDSSNGVLRTRELVAAYYVSSVCSAALAGTKLSGQAGVYICSLG